MIVTLPCNFEPRDYQKPILKAMDSGCTRAVCVWPRRSGKDKVLMNIIAKKMLDRVGTYFYIAPTYKQGKKIIWNGMDAKGFKFTDHIPKEIRLRTDNTEMLIEIKNHSIFQIIGSDNIDSIVGSNPIGVVFTEYSLQNPAVWAYLKPILDENGGFAIFNYTARGKNHGFTMYQMAKKLGWFNQLLTVNDTHQYTDEKLEEIRQEYVDLYNDDALYYQEYFNRWEVPMMGAYYGKQMNKVRDDGRIGKVPIISRYPIDTFWDLGMDDSTTIWFVQRTQSEKRIVDYYENSGEGLSHYAQVLNEKGYLYGKHYGPHDLAVRELGTGVSRREVAKKLGINFEIVPNLPIDDGIEAVRRILGSCWFDEEKCDKGIAALNSYHKEYDETNKIYRSMAKHDWSSHGADAFRMFAVATSKTPKIYVPGSVSHSTVKPFA